MWYHYIVINIEDNLIHLNIAGTTFWRLFNCFVECWKHLQLLNKSKLNCLNQKVNCWKHLVIDEKILRLFNMKHCSNVFITLFNHFGKLMKPNCSLLKYSLIDETDWIMLKPSCKLVKSNWQKVYVILHLEGKEAH